METFYWYRGYGIRYVQLTGTTYVELLGDIVATFPQQGKIEGDRNAHKWVNRHTDAD